MMLLIHITIYSILKNWENCYEEKMKWYKEQCATNQHGVTTNWITKVNSLRCPSYLGWMYLPILFCSLTWEKYSSCPSLIWMWFDFMALEIFASRKRCIAYFTPPWIQSCLSISRVNAVHIFPDFLLYVIGNRSVTYFTSGRLQYYNVWNGLW